MASSDCSRDNMQQIAQGSVNLVVLKR